MARARLLTIAFAAGLAGCGGGDDNTAEAPPAKPKPPPAESTPAEPPEGDEGKSQPGDADPSAVDYRRRGNRLCKTGRMRIEAVDAPRSPDDLASYLDEVLDIGDRTIAPIKALEPPRDLAARHAEAAKLVDEEFDLLRGIVRDIEAGEDPAETFVAAQPRLERVLDDENAAWRDLGLTECVDSNTTGAPPDETLS